MAFRGNNTGLLAFRWKKRLLLILAPTAADDRYLEQMREFAAHTAGFVDRDLILIQLFERDESRVDECPLNRFESSTLRERFGVGEGEFATILVGKDGEEKLRSSSPVPVSEIFSLIDTMPMRKLEKKQESM